MLQPLVLPPYDPSLDADCLEIYAQERDGRTTNSAVDLAVLPNGRLVAAWTQCRKRDDEPRCSVLCSLSDDGGKSWSPPVVVESGDKGKSARTVALFVVPHTLRLYAFYWWNENADPDEYAGCITFRQSADQGETWGQRWQIPMPEHDIDLVQDEFYGWLDGPAMLTPDGAMLLGFTKTTPLARDQGEVEEGAAPDSDLCRSEAFFLRADNILTETDPFRMLFRVTPEEEVGLHAPQRRDPDIPLCQGPTVALLPSGRLLAVMRTRAESPYYSISEDYGITWTPARALRDRPGGDALPHGCTPCHVSSAPDGRIFLLFSNTCEPVGGDEAAWDRHYINHDPLCVCVGRELHGFSRYYPPEDNNAGLYFDHPRPVLQGVGDTVDNTWTVDPRLNRRTARHARLLHVGDRHLLAYDNERLDLRVKAVPGHLLAAHSIPWAEKIARKQPDVSETLKLPRRRRNALRRQT